VTIIGSVAVGIVGIVFADFITGGIMAAKGEVQILARDYMQIIVGGSFSILLLLQLVAILRAVGDSRTPMLLLVGSNILNLFLSVLMVYGPGEAPEIFSWGPPIAEFFGIARDGVVGAATSTVISRSAAIAIGLVVLAKHSGGLRFPLRHLIPQGAEIRKLMRIAWPNSSQFLLRVGVIIFFMGIISHMFTTAEDSSVLAAFGICVRLDTVALFTGMGWGAAASTFVGQNLGAGQPARAYRAGWISGIYNALMMLLVLVLYLVYAPQIVGFFDSSGGVVAAGTEYLQIVGGSYAFLGIAVVLSQSLSGAGATLSSFVIDAMVLAGLQIPFTILWLIIADVDRMDIWWIIAAGNVVSAFAYAAWYGKKDWLDKKI
jgi:putative MATE family efflux protein